MNWIQKIVASIGIDKMAHFAVSAFLTLALGRFLPWWAPSVIVLMLGIAKECLDGVFDRKDLLADACGILLGTLVLLI